MDIIIPNANFVYVEEMHGSDACFAIASIITKILKNNLGSVCLVLFHHSFNHYQNVILKLGCNLEIARNKGIIRVIEISEYLFKYLTKLNNTTSHIDCSDLFTDVMKKLELLNYRTENTYLIMEDVSYLLLTKSVEECISFIRTFYSFTSHLLTLKLLLSSHVNSSDEEQTRTSTLIKYMADVVVKVIPLKTGFSSDISGHVEIIDTTKVINKPLCYAYKLENDRVIVNYSSRYL